jgi:phosphatidate cytidylyltransferase
MILTVYIIIIVYFLIGVVGFFFINRKLEPAEARKSWKKTIIYFVIINIVSLSIVINPIAFRCLAVIIIIAGFYEIYKLFRESGYKQKDYFLLSILLFALFSSGFFVFSGMEKELIFYSFAIISIFDGFSQITGQLWGKRKIFPKVSPNKTITGFIGGFIVAILSGILLKDLIAIPVSKAIILAAGVAVFAFVGDALCSYYKRKHEVKDFSNLIPEHGGFLDRFDSLIAGGAWIALSGLIINA